jgi:hypothetical protein
MKSRVHPNYTTKYRVGNWRAYDRALVRRGDVTLWLSADATDAWRPSPPRGPGGQPHFSDVAIETAWTLRLIFRLPLRQIEGFLRSILALMSIDLDAPDHTTLSRRSRHLNIKVHGIPASGPIYLIIDSRGISIVGAGEWAAVKHGGSGRRSWNKPCLAVDGTGLIVGHALTESTVDDATTRIQIIEVVDDEVARVTVDTAYDTVSFSEAAVRRGATVVVPPARTATVSRRRPRSSARDHTITQVQQVGRRRWKKVSGYHRQARAENAFFRYKSILGEALHSRTSGAQTVEIQLACNILNRMTVLGRPESYATGR